jgi:beta-lactamase regulating signal transducer with metallopeptidase domain
MLYLLALSSMLGLAAVSAERALRWLNMPVRGTWALALLGTPAVALLVARTGGLRLLGSSESSSSGTAAAAPTLGADSVSALERWVASAEAIVLDPFVGALNTVLASAGALDRPLLAVWGACSAGVLLALLVSLRRLHLASRNWPRRRVEGRDVRVSEDLGPAVLGIGRAEVVLPTWVLEQDPASRRLIVLHESEHLEARDGTLLFAGLLVAAAFPWNPLAWWQLRRLRLAVELDCDRRVLRSGVGLREYASLLLEAGSRRAVPFGSTAAFVHFDSQLGRRIRMMMENRKAPRYVPAAVALTMAAAILIVACSAPAPLETDTVAAAEQAPQAVAGKLIERLHEETSWTALEEVPEGNEIIDLQSGEGQDFVFKSDDGTFHLSEEGELREISREEFGERFGQGEDGVFELLLAPEDPVGTWTLEEGGTVSLKLIEEKHRNEVLHEADEDRVRFGP